MKRDVLIVAHFSGDLDDNTNNRFNYLSRLFVESGYNVELVTSSFSHKQKIQRKITNNFEYKVDFIFEPGYSKNVSLKRLYSHRVMAKNLRKDLRSRKKKPDLIYCAVPSLDVAKTVATYASRNNIKYIIDVQDLWPEAFKMLFNFPLLSIIFKPMTIKANKIYKSADGIIAVSETYLERIQIVTSNKVKSKVVYLGTDLTYFDRCARLHHIKRNDNEIWLGYIGTLGHNYDLITVMDGLRILKDLGYTNLKFIVMGDGPLRGKFERHAVENQIDVCFTGILPYDVMVGFLVSCDIAINPIAKGAAGSIINKHGDYAAASLPVVNTQESYEYRKLVDTYNIGLNCINNNSEDFAKKLQILLDNEALRDEMGKNSRRLANEKFDRKITYPNIITFVADIVG